MPRSSRQTVSVALSFAALSCLCSTFSARAQVRETSAQMEAAALQDDLRKTESAISNLKEQLKGLSPQDPKADRILIRFNSLDEHAQNVANKMGVKRSTQIAPEHRKLLNSVMAEKAREFQRISAEKQLMRGSPEWEEERLRIKELDKVSKGFNERMANYGGVPGTATQAAPASSAASSSGSGSAGNGSGGPSTSQAGTKSSAQTTAKATGRALEIGEWVVSPDGRVGQVTEKLAGGRYRISNHFAGGNSFDGSQLTPEARTSKVLALAKGQSVMDSLSPTQVERVFEDGRVQLKGRPAGRDVYRPETLNPEVESFKTSQGVEVRKGAVALDAQKNLRTVKRVYAGGIIEYDPEPGRPNLPKYAHVSQAAIEVAELEGLSLGSKVGVNFGSSDEIVERVFKGNENKVLLYGDGPVAGRVYKLGQIVKFLGGAAGMFSILLELKGTPAEAAELRGHTPEALEVFLHMTPENKAKLLEQHPDYAEYIEKTQQEAWDALATIQEVQCDGAKIRVLTSDRKGGEIWSEVTLDKSGNASSISQRDPKTGWEFGFDIRDNEATAATLTTYGGGFPLGNSKERKSHLTMGEFRKLTESSGTPAPTQAFAKRSTIALASVLIKSDVVSLRCPQWKTYQPGEPAPHSSVPSRNPRALKEHARAVK